MKALILTGRFGMGHVSAAEAVKEEFEKEYGKGNATVVDLVEYLFPVFSRFIYIGFGLVADKFSRLYNLLNKVDGHHTISPMKRWFARKFQTLIVKYQPDLLVSTWPVGSKYIGAYKKRTKDTIPYITCITDISAHSEWISDETTAYIVSDDVSKIELEKKGIDADRLFVGGIPVRQDFKAIDSAAENKSDLLNKTTEVLMMGGGLGLIPGAEEMLTYLEKLPEVHVTVITGNNEKLRASLEGKHENTDVLGYTENVAEYMKKADFIISKAGGITLFESIYTETPMIVVDPFLEQEKKNAEYIKTMNIGKVLGKNTEDMWEIIGEMIKGDSTITQMRNNMKQIKERISQNGIDSVIKSTGIGA